MFSEADGHSMVKNVQTEASKIAQQSKSTGWFTRDLGFDSQDPHCYSVFWPP